jgi:SAM-dependent methyltransferase
MITQLDEVSRRIRDTDLVLDVGGWACPFNRADYVLDGMPWEGRGFYASLGWPRSQGPDAERFSEQTWITRDICGPERWPFTDKFFDFAVCSHTLEDVRDPLFVCAELIRVAKRGYIEVPSRLAESCRGAERDDMAGLSHHRWLVEIDRGHLRFSQKYHLIHTDFDLSLPKRFLARLSEEQRVSWLFWEESFTFEEVWLHGVESIYGELRDFVRGHHVYPRHRYWLQAAGRFLKRAQGRIARQAGRLRP